MYQGFNIAERLVKVRESHNFTQKEVAKMIGMHERTYQDNEYGKNIPKATTIIALARLYGVSADYLLGLKDTP